MHCSECGYEWDESEQVSNFCPQCGAKMEISRPEPIIKGEYLDNKAEDYGLSRQPGESDRELADRIVEKIEKRML